MQNPIPVALVPESFWDKVQPTGFCWEWTGAKRRYGYGYLHIRTVQYLAHRVSYALLVEDRPDLVLDHLCRNTSCVNPDHLEPVSSVENTMRNYSPWSVNARKEECPKGHDFDTHGYVYRGARNCRQCRREQWRIWAANKRREQREARNAGATECAGV